MEVDSEKLRQHLYEAMVEYLSPSLKVAEEVPQIVKDQAILENEDVNGNQMPQKKPRPVNNPKNFPNLALVVSGNMMDHTRWRIDDVSETQRNVVYTPPDYFEYVLEKRPWISDEKINPNALAIILQRMRELIEGA
jgi:hypothetical protein